METIMKKTLVIAALALSVTVSAAHSETVNVGMSGGCVSNVVETL
jgi:putative amino-acid transport system substrate-binding protein